MSTLSVVATRVTIVTHYSTLLLTGLYRDGTGQPAQSTVCGVEGLA